MKKIKGKKSTKPESKKNKGIGRSRLWFGIPEKSKSIVLDEKI
jgi:hypothetical protein